MYTRAAHSEIHSFRDLLNLIIYYKLTKNMLTWNRILFWNTSRHFLRSNPIRTDGQRQFTNKITLPIPPITYSPYRILPWTGKATVVYFTGKLLAESRRILPILLLFDISFSKKIPNSPFRKGRYVNIGRHI